MNRITELSIALLSLCRPNYHVSVQILNLPDVSSVGIHNINFSHCSLKSVMNYTEILYFILFIPNNNQSFINFSHSIPNNRHFIHFFLEDLRQYFRYCLNSLGVDFNK